MIPAPDVRDLVQQPLLVMALTPTLLTIMLGGYYCALVLWDKLNARWILKKAIKEAKKSLQASDGMHTS